MNRTVEINAHRHRIVPPRWGFGLFWGPLPRPMAWADIGLSRCDVGAPVNDTRAGFGSGTHFHAIIDGGRHFRTSTPRHAATHTSPPIRRPHRGTSHSRNTHIKQLSARQRHRPTAPNKHRHTANTHNGQTTAPNNHRPTTNTNGPRKIRNPEWGGPMSAQAIGLGSRPHHTKHNPNGVARNSRPTGNPITANERCPNDTMNQTT